MRVYLDNCCYNRPYDDQSQIRISLEAQAKIYIQDMIRDGLFELASSYVLIYENSMNPYEIRRKTILNFLEEYTFVYIDESLGQYVGKIAWEIINDGIKPQDAFHLASAVFAQCDYFITTDDRLLKYKSDRILILDPVEFIRENTGGENV